MSSETIKPAHAISDPALDNTSFPANSTPDLDLGGYSFLPFCRTNRVRAICGIEHMGHCHISDTECFADQANTSLLSRLAQDDRHASVVRKRLKGCCKRAVAAFSDSSTSVVLQDLVPYL